MIDDLNTSPDFDEIWPAAVGADYDVVVMLGEFARAIRVGTGGDLTVVNSRGRTVLIHNLAAGETITGAIREIKAAGSTAFQLLVML